MKNTIALITNNISRIKNLSFYLSAALMSGLIGVFFNPFLAKNLSHSDYSIIGYYASFGALFTPLLNFSLISYYVRSYFKIEEEKRQLTLDTIITTLLLWGLISSFVILILFYVYCELTGVEIPFMPFALMSVAQLFFNNFLLLYQVNCRMQRRAKSYFKITLSSSLVAILLSIVLVIIFKFGVLGRMSALLIASASIGFFSIKNTIYKFRIDFSIVKEALLFAWPVSVAYIIQFFLIGIDISFLEKLNDTTNMGLYVVALSITGYLSILYTALSQTFEPDLYKAVADYNYRKIVKIITLILTILMPIILLFITLSKPILSLLTFNKYTDAYYFAQILSIGVLTTYLMVAVEGIINAFGFTKITLINKIAGSLLAIFFYQYLIGKYQFYGATWGRVLAPFFVFIIGAISLLFLKNRIKTGHNAK
jgi:O-antigen/teichoic acid export membrane protein